MTEIFENNQLQFAQVLTQVASYAKSPEARNQKLASAGPAIDQTGSCYPLAR